MKVQKLIYKGKVVGVRLYLENIDVYVDTDIELFEKLLNKSKKADSSLGDIHFENGKNVSVYLSEGMYISNNDERNVLEVKDFNTLYRLVFGDVKGRISIFGIRCSETRFMHNKICEIMKALSSNPCIMFSFIYETLECHPKLKVDISFRALKGFIDFIVSYYKSKGINKIHINNELKDIKELSLESISEVPLTTLYGVEDFSVEFLYDDDYLLRITSVFSEE